MNVSEIVVECDFELVHHQDNLVTLKREALVLIRFTSKGTVLSEGLMILTIDDE